MNMLKLLYYDLEHGSQTLGSSSDIEKMFGYPELEPSTYKEFQDIIRQLYTPSQKEEIIDIKKDQKKKYSKQTKKQTKGLMLLLKSLMNFIMLKLKLKEDNGNTKRKSTIK